MNRPEASHEQVYRGLLRLYPSEFRARFGDEMVQLFGDQLRDARTGRAQSGFVGTWLRTLGDLAVTAASEHTRKDRTVAQSLAQPPSMMARTLGILGVVGGLVLLAGFIPNLLWGANGFLLRLLLFNLGAMAIGIAVHVRQASTWPRLSLAATAPMILANAWYLVMSVLSIGRPVYPEPDADFRPIYFYAGVAMWLTDAIFGLVAFRLGVVSRTAALVLAVGAIVGGSGIGGLAGTFPWLSALVAFLAPFQLWGIVLIGAGWVLLGIDVAFRRRLPKQSSQVLPTAEILDQTS
ncbi:MAG: hypothetical protein V4515_09765 [Chloroflexota bacterium]